ncbi:glycosyltransferase family 2 protein [Legionella dresdenensis]|uniref:Glycosyltransferase family 2 protein n=1 Tax=Legionella dresdenensis TaxID=450200 RepID=A0ABV8CC15_9GAMM
MSKLNELSVIIPVYNEVDNVENLYLEIVAALPENQFIFEVIFIDDGSKDGTREKLLALSACHSNLRVLCHKQNYGQSAGLISGAKAARYPVLVTLDGDGQNDPADISLLFNHFSNEKVVVLGNRTKRDDNWLRKFSSRTGNTVRQLFLKDDCPDTGCSLKLFPRDAFLSLPHFNHLHRFLPALFKRAGYQLVNVPVNHRPRWFGQSKYGVMNRLFVGIHDLIGVRWLLKRRCAPEILVNE